MKNLRYLPILLIFIACSKKEKTDQELLDQDRQALKEDLVSGKVVPYKFVKLMFRGYASDDTTFSSQPGFKRESDALVEKMMKLGHDDKLTPKDYWAMFKLYQEMDDFVTKNDEDQFPVLVDAFRKYWTNAKSNSFLKNKAKLEQEAQEHAFLSALAMCSASLGTEVALYECAETDVTLLPDSEIKGDLRFMRGFIFMQKKLFYLSENEYSENLSWLKKNKSVDLTYTVNSLQLGKFNKQQSYVFFRGFNHLFRGVDRSMMSRDIDQERALEDFDQFLKDCKTLKFENELVWAIEAYVNVKKGKNKEAIASLRKLKNSKHLRSEDKEIIDEALDLLEKEDADEASKSISENAVLQKISSAFVYSHLKNVNTNKIIKKSKVPNASKIAQKVGILENTVNQIERFSDGETLNEATKKAEKESKNYIDKAEDFLGL